MLLTSLLLSASPVSQNIESVGALVDGASKLSYTSHEVGVYNTITGVFLVIVLLFISMQMVSFYKMTTKLNSISEASTKTLLYFTTKLQKDVGVDQARSIVGEIINQSANGMKIQVLIMKELNHIDDVERTEKRIQNFIDQQVERRKNHLSKFEYNEKDMSRIIDHSKVADAFDLMKELLYTPSSEFTVEMVTRRVDEFYSRLKFYYYQRLDEL